MVFHSTQALLSGPPAEVQTGGSVYYVNSEHIHGPVQSETQTSGYPLSLMLQPLIREMKMVFV